MVISTHPTSATRGGRAQRHDVRPVHMLLAKPADECRYGNKPVENNQKKRGEGDDRGNVSKGSDKRADGPNKRRSDYGNFEARMGVIPSNR